MVALMSQLSNLILFGVSHCIPILNIQDLTWSSHPMVSDFITFKTDFFTVPSEVFFRCQGTCVLKSVFRLKAYSIC